jgi:hypothetical protein
VQKIIIKNGLYALNATSRDGVSDDVGGVQAARRPLS